MTRGFVLLALIAFSACGVGEERIVERGQRVQPVQIVEPERDEIHPGLSRQDVDRILKRDLMAHDLVGPRPDPEGSPTVIKIGLFIADITSVDDVDQTFTAGMRTTLRWVDPRLASEDKEVRIMPLRDVWNPLIRVLNQREVVREFAEDVFVASDGHVAFGQRLFGTFAAPLNLRDFPFDTHDVTLTVHSFFGPGEIQFFIDKEMSGWGKTLTIPDWKVSGGMLSTDTVYSPHFEKEMSQIDFTFHIERMIGFYLWKIIIPLCLIVMMSWGVFWIAPQRLEAQVGLAATAFLTLFAFQFAISMHLPKIAYLTRMDRFTMSCSVLVFLALAESLLTSYYAAREQPDKALRIDRVARVLFPLAFVGVCLLAFVF